MRRLITDEDAAALLTGHVPADRPDLAALAASVADFRSAALGTLPQPSAELSVRLEGATESMAAPVASRPAARNSGLKRVITWLLGLGLAAKIALATTAAAAAVTGAGVAGVLPAGVQETFDTVISVVTPTEGADEESIGVVVPDEEGGTLDGGPGAFGHGTSERAHEVDDVGDGRQHGEDTSEAAQQLGEEKRQNRPQQADPLDVAVEQGSNGHGKGNDGKGNDGKGNDGKGNDGKGNDGSGKDK